MKKINTNQHFLFGFVGFLSDQHVSVGFPYTYREKLPMTNQCSTGSSGFFQGNGEQTVSETFFFLRGPFSQPNIFMTHSQFSCLCAKNVPKTLFKIINKHVNQPLCIEQINYEQPVLQRLLDAVSALLFFWAMPIPTSFRPSGGANSSGRWFHMPKWPREGKAHQKRLKKLCWEPLIDGSFLVGLHLKTRFPFTKMPKTNWFAFIQLKTLLWKITSCIAQFIP